MQYSTISNSSVTKTNICLQGLWTLTYQCNHSILAGCCCSYYVNRRQRGRQVCNTHPVIRHQARNLLFVDLCSSNVFSIVMPSGMSFFTGCNVLLVSAHLFFGSSRVVICNCSIYDPSAWARTMLWLEGQSAIFICLKWCVGQCQACILQNPRPWITDPLCANLKTTTDKPIVETIAENLPCDNKAWFQKRLKSLALVVNKQVIQYGQTASISQYMCYSCFKGYGDSQDLTKLSDLPTESGLMEGADLKNWAGKTIRAGSPIAPINIARSISSPNCIQRPIVTMVQRFGL